MIKERCIDSIDIYWRRKVQILYREYVTADIGSRDKDKKHGTESNIG